MSGNDRAKALALTPVSRETAQRLDHFAALLRLWQKRTNLIAASTLPQLWTRHIADSLQLLAFAPHARHWIDLGSGGGFPGLVIACAIADLGGHVHLVESNTKKAAFLREAGRVTGSPIVVHPERIETFSRRPQDHFDVITARAVAPLPKLLDYVQPLMRPGTQALLLKGQDVAAELTESSKYWRIDADLKPSITSPEGRIAVIHRLERLAAVR